MDYYNNRATLWNWQRELLALKGHQQGPSTSQSGPYLRHGAEKFLHSLCETSLRLFMYLYQDLNGRPWTIDGYRTAIVDTLGPAGFHFSQSSDLNRVLSIFFLPFVILYTILQYQLLKLYNGLTITMSYIFRTSCYT